MVLLSLVSVLTVDLIKGHIRIGVFITRDNPVWNWTTWKNQMLHSILL